MGDLRNIRKNRRCADCNQEKHPYSQEIKPILETTEHKTELFNLISETLVEVFEAILALVTTQIYYAISNYAIETQDCHPWYKKRE